MDVNKVILSPNIIIIQYIFIIGLWMITPNSLFQLFGGTKQFNWYMVVYVILALLLWYLSGVFVKKSIKLEKETEETILINMMVLRILAVISILSGTLLIINSLRNGASLIPENLHNNIKIVRASTIAGVTTWTELVYPVLVTYFYLFLKKNKFKLKDKLLIIINLLLILFRTLFMARTNLFTIIIFTVVMYIEMKNIKIKLKYIIFGAIAFLAFYILIESGRTYSVDYRAQQYSPIQWGLKMFNIYFSSSVNYLFNLVDVQYPVQVLSIPFRFVYDFLDIQLNFNYFYNTVFSTGGMTTITVLGEFFASSKFFSLLYVFLYSVICNYFYILFRNKKIVGILVYPIIYVPIIYMPFIYLFTRGNYVITYFGIWLIYISSKRYKKLL